MENKSKPNKLESVRQQRYGVFTSADTWGLEALKHIALVGTAGVAAVFALLAASKGMSKSEAFMPGLCFALGSVLATLAMATGYVQREAMLGIYLEAEELIEKDLLHDPEAHRLYLYLHAKASAFGPLITVIGGAAMFADAIGGILLFRAMQG